MKKKKIHFYDCPGSPHPLVEISAKNVSFLFLPSAGGGDEGPGDQGEQNHPRDEKLPGDKDLKCDGEHRQAGQQ